MLVCERDIGRVGRHLRFIQDNSFTVARGVPLARILHPAGAERALDADPGT